MTLSALDNRQKVEKMPDFGWMTNIQGIAIFFLKFTHLITSPRFAILDKYEAIH